MAKSRITKYALNIWVTRDTHWQQYNMLYCVSIKCTVNSITYVCTF